jgi:hypothetical protein
VTSMDAVSSAWTACISCAGLAALFYWLAYRTKAKGTMSRGLALTVVGAGFLLGAGLSFGAAVDGAAEIDEGRYALLALSMPVDQRLVPVVKAAMKDGRISKAEYDRMKYVGAIPDRKDMRTIVFSVSQGAELR